MLGAVVSPGRRHGERRRFPSPATSRAGDGVGEAEAGAELRVRLAPHVPRGPCCRRSGARPLPRSRRSRRSLPSAAARRRRMADLRFRLAEPLQLVARRNEKSSAELSRFLAKQVSGRRGARRQPPGRPAFLPPGGSRRVRRGGKGTRGAAYRPPRAAISSRQLCLLPAPPGDPSRPLVLGRPPEPLCGGGGGEPLCVCVWGGGGSRSVCVCARLVRFLPLLAPFRVL